MKYKGKNYIMTMYEVTNNEITGLNNKTYTRIGDTLLNNVDHKFFKHLPEIDEKTIEEICKHSNLKHTAIGFVGGVLVAGSIYGLIKLHNHTKSKDEKQPETSCNDNVNIIEFRKKEQKDTCKRKSSC